MTKEEKEQWMLENDLLIIKAVSSFIKQNDPNFEDFVQEGRLRAFIALEEYQPGKMSLSTYVYNRVFYRTYDLARSKKRLEDMLIYIGDENIDHIKSCHFLQDLNDECVLHPIDSKIVSGHGLYEYLMRIIEVGVDEFQQQSIIDWLRGYTAKEIAEKGNISVRLVRRNVHEAKPMLMEFLTREWLAS